MTDKTSEDLVFEKLRTPSLQEMFAEQIYERRKTQKGSFLLYYVHKFENGDYRVVTVPVEDMHILSSDKHLEYHSMDGPMPVFNYKKD